MNKKISYFLVLMHSPYVGNTNIINGHTIYNALLRWTDVNADDIEKVSFGIPQNVPIALKGSNKYKINVQEEPKIDNKRNFIKDSILDNLNKGYEAFKILRSTENILSNPNIDYSPIPFDIVKPKFGTLIAHKIDYFTFYIIWKDIIHKDDFTNVEFTLGRRRNDGYGFSRIERMFNTDMNNLLSGVPEEQKFTAMNGITGIYNHARYGFGEYVINKSQRTEKNLIKLTTPLCMKSTMTKTTQYGSLPMFFKPSMYEKVNYNIWNKGIKHNLECIDSGKVFEVQEENYGY